MTTSACRDLVGDLVGAARPAPWCTIDAQLGREPLRLGRPVADDGRRRDHQRGTASARVEQVGEHGGRLAQAHVEGEAAADAGRRRGSRARRAPRPGSCAARRRSPWARVAGSPDRSAAAASRSAAQPPPSTVMPPARGVPSSPRARRSMSAPVSWVVLGPFGERGWPRRGGRPCRARPTGRRSG